MSNDLTKLNEWSEPIEVRDSKWDKAKEVTKSKEGWNLIKRGEVRGS